MPPPPSPAIVHDSQDDDSDYDFDLDLARFKQRQAAFAKELHRRSAMAPPSSSSDDFSDNELTAFLNPAHEIAPHDLPAPTKLSIADLLALAQRNTARDLEIHRAELLLRPDPPLPSSSSPAQDPSPPPPPPQSKSQDQDQDLPCQWAFFDLTAITPPRSPPSPRHLNAAWRAALAPFNLGLPTRDLDSDTTIRDFLLSGSVADALSGGFLKLEPSLQPWLLDELCLQQDQALSTAYFHIILASRDHFDTPLLDEGRIKRLFESIGASENALDFDKPLQLSSSSENLSRSHRNSAPSWWNVSLVLKLLTKFTQSLTPAQLRTSWALVIRLSLDENRRMDGNCDAELLDLAEAFMDKFESSQHDLVENILADMRFSIANQPLQIQTLDLIPVTSAFSHKFKRRLALIFFSNSPAYLQEELVPNLLMDTIVEALTSTRTKAARGAAAFVRVQNVLDMINIAIDDARWCSKVATVSDSGQPELLLEKLILFLKHSKETIQEANDLNIEKSDAKDSFTKLILRLECLFPRTRSTQTMMDKYFRSETAA